MLGLCSFTKRVCKFSRANQLTYRRTQHTLTCVRVCVYVQYTYLLILLYIFGRHIHTQRHTHIHAYHTCTHIYTRTHTHIHTCIHTYIHTYIHTDTYTPFACICTCIHPCMHACMHACMPCLHTRTHVRACMYRTFLVSLRVDRKPGLMKSAGLNCFSSCHDVLFHIHCLFSHG